jgi:NADH:ubiquinone oxidoreductase subunit K
MRGHTRVLETMNTPLTTALALLQVSITENMRDGLLHPDISKFLIIGALLFSIGVAGVLTRRNIIVIFMSIELILNAANLNFIAFSRYLQESGSLNAVAGQVFTVFIIVVAAAEAAIGLGLVIALYRNRETIFVDKIDLLKW